MSMRHVTPEEALRELANVTPHAMHEMPRFVAAPRALGARRSNGRLTVVFQCHDSANDADYVVEAPYGEMPANEEQGMDQMLTAARVALDIAERTARAVWN